MAQIKKIVKPGDLIRGADVGIAALDKDGNVVGTGIDAEDLAAWPEGAQSGDVLAWGGETGAEWRPHYPENGSEGDVLTLGETGPEWVTPSSGGTDLYCHTMRIIYSPAGVKINMMIINKSSAAINTGSALYNIIETYSGSQNSDIMATGRFTSDGQRHAVSYVTSNSGLPTSFVAGAEGDNVTLIIDYASVTIQDVVSKIT